MAHLEATMRTYLTLTTFTHGDRQYGPGQIVRAHTPEQDEALRAKHLRHLRERPFGEWPAANEPEPQAAPALEQPEPPKKRAKGKTVEGEAE